MDYYKIILPTGQNDYLCRTMLDGELCVLHLSYNSTGDFWTIGFCNDEGEPIVDLSIERVVHVVQRAAGGARGALNGGQNHAVFFR